MLCREYYKTLFKKEIYIGAENANQVFVEKDYFNWLENYCSNRIKDILNELENK